MPNKTITTKILFNNTLHNVYCCVNATCYKVALHVLYATLTCI